MEVKGNDKPEGETEDGLSGFDLFPPDVPIYEAVCHLAVSAWTRYPVIVDNQHKLSHPANPSRSLSRPLPLPLHPCRG